MRGWRWLAIIPLVLGLESLVGVVAGEWTLLPIACGLLGVAAIVWRKAGGTKNEARGTVRWVALAPFGLGIQVLLASVIFRAWGGFVVGVGFLVVAAIIWRVVGGTWSSARIR